MAVPVLPIHGSRTAPGAPGSPRRRRAVARAGLECGPLPLVEPRPRGPGGALHVARSPRRQAEREPSHFDVVLEEDKDGDEADPSDMRRDEAIAGAIRAAKPRSEDHGLSYADAGDIVGYSETWVGDRIAEWREGQHRDLVEDPMDGSD